MSHTYIVQAISLNRDFMFFPVVDTCLKAMCLGSQVGLQSRLGQKIKLRCSKKASQVLALAALGVKEVTAAAARVDTQGSLSLNTRIIPTSFLSCPHRALIHRWFKMHSGARADTLPGFAWMDVLECHKLPK